MERYYSFNQYLRERFNERVHRLSINAEFQCPNLNGEIDSLGCIYCNNKGFSHFTHEPVSIEAQIEQSIKFYEKKIGVKKFIAYFQAFTNTYAPIEELRVKYEKIRKFPQIVGLFISTRPDCVDQDKIKLINDYQKDYLVWVEYGLQTTHNHILETINRNHTYEDFLNAYQLSKKYNLNVGVHLIIGLPLQTYADMLEDISRLKNLGVNGIKFHLLHVLKNTELEKQYLQGKIKLLDENEYVKIICDLIERLPKTTVIFRLVSSADDKYLVAPKWINQRGQVIEKIRSELEKRNTCQGNLYKNQC